MVSQACLSLLVEELTNESTSAYRKAIAFLFFAALKLCGMIFTITLQMCIACVRPLIPRTYGYVRKGTRWVMIVLGLRRNHKVRNANDDLRAVVAWLDRNEYKRRKKALA